LCNCILNLYNKESWPVDLCKKASHPRNGRAVREKDVVVSLTLNSPKALPGKNVEGEGCREGGWQAELKSLDGIKQWGDSEDLENS
jgi:hypothetical protein